MPDGPYEFYHENGQLSRKGTDTNGKAIGPFKSYHENGQLRSTGNFGSFKDLLPDGDGDRLNTLIDGPYERYDENGQLLRKGTFVLNTECGEWIEEGEAYIYPPCSGFFVNNQPAMRILEDNFLFGIAFLFIVIIAIRRRLNAPKRKKKFAELAESLGMTLVPDFPYRSRFGFGLFQTPEEKRYSTKTLKNLPTLPIFTKTKQERVTDPLIGDPEKFGLEQEVTVTILEYVFNQGKAKKMQTVIHISDPKLDLPYFSLSPQKVFSKAVNFFTKEKDIDFELSRMGTEFSKQFLLKGPVEDSIRLFFTEDIMRFLTTQITIQKKLCLQGVGTHLVIFEEMKSLSIDRPFGGIFSRRPRKKHVFEEYRFFLDQGMEVYRKFSESSNNNI